MGSGAHCPFAGPVQFNSCHDIDVGFGKIVRQTVEHPQAMLETEFANLRDMAV